MKIQGVVEDRLVLLKGVSGAFRPGVLTALMGVSGAGKTTLMDVLAGRKTGGYIEGDIKISGYPKKQETFARIAGYCEQNDIHSPHVTVYESLLYSAWLRLPPEVDSETRKVGTHFLKFTSDIWDSVCRFGFCEYFSFQYLFPFGLLVIHSSSINLISIT
jgi:ABC-type multidrug transport system ATPase subunit